MSSSADSTRLPSNDLLERIAQLSPEKRALLERRLAKRGRGVAQNLPPENDAPASDRSHQVSFSQQQMWLLDRVHGASSLYNIARAFHIKGALDTKALQESVRAIVARHEALRTTLEMTGSGLKQVVHETPRLPITILHLDQREDLATRARRKTAADEIVQRESNRSFDLAADSVLRLFIIRIDKDEFVVLLVMHHIACDGWSINLFYAELEELYAAAVEHREPTLPILPIQYSQYANQQRLELTDDNLRDRLTFWRQRLANLPARTLPCDHPESGRRRFKGGLCTAFVGAEIGTKLGDLARRHGTTFFVVALSAYKLLLHRFFRLEDVVVGTPVAGRSRSDVQHLIGCFVNTVVLRTDLSDDPTFADIISRVKSTTAEALAHQELPFEKLIEALCPDRGSASTPLIQTIFSVNPETHLVLSGRDGLEATKWRIERGTAKFDLSADVAVSPDGLVCSFLYNVDRFDGSTIRSLSTAFERILEEIAAVPSLRADEYLRTLTREPSGPLAALNDTETEYPRDAAVHALFREQATTRPEAVAIDDGNCSLSYGELDRWTDRLAAELVAHGLQSGTRVGVLSGRSFEFIAGCLATLKAGGAYVPLDPSYPKERLEYMAADANLSWLLTGPDAHDAMPAIGVVSVVPIRRDGLPTDIPPVPSIEPDSAAYVMYTSGSTGDPKGVVIPHRGIVRLVRNTNYISLTSDDTVAHASNVAFDASTFEIWGALLNGARLTILDHDDVIDPRRLRTILRARGVSAIFVTTALFNAIAHSVPQAFEGVRTVLFGGEAADPEAVRAVLRAAPPSRLLNVYGPTETTTFATWHRIGDLPEDVTSVPIGRPISNTRTYVLDRAGRPVKPPATGELYIGGDGVALGYLGDRDRTNERFLPDPYSPDSGQRMYRTGDRVRWTAENVLEYVGREDRLVKLRGYRIELDEIEAVLTRHPAVQQVAVEVRRDGRGGELAAFVVAAHGRQLRPADLRQFAATKLPKYMIPAGVHVLDEMPLTANGKLDRERLASLHVGFTTLQSQEEPVSDHERALLSVWRRVLKREDLTVCDDFFEMGGHSLLAIRLFHEMEQVFGFRLPVATIFEAPTVQQLARHIHTLSRLEAGSLLETERSLIAIRDSGTRPPLILVHGISANPLHYQPLVELLHADQPVYGIQGQGLDGCRISDTSVEEMASRYADEIIASLSNGPCMIAGFCYGGLVAYELAQQLERRGKEVKLLALMDAFNPCRRERIKRRAAWLRSLATRREAPTASPIPTYSIRRLLQHGRYRARHLARLARVAVCRTMLSAGYRTPSRWRSEYVQSVYQRTIAEYKPDPYGGSAALFWSTDQGGHALKREWEGLLANPAVYGITGGHYMMRTDARFDLGQKLENAISETLQRKVRTNAA